MVKTTNKSCTIIIVFIGVLALIPVKGLYADTLPPDLDSLISNALRFQNIDLKKADSIAFLIINKSKELKLSNTEAKGYYFLATTERLRNHNIEAIKHYQKALDIYKQNKNNYEIHEVNKWLGLCYALESEYETGLLHIESSLRYADSLKLIDSKAQILLNMARFYYSMGDFSHSLLVCNDARALQDSIKDKELAWKINNFTGFVLLLNNEHKSALELLTQSFSEQDKFIHNSTEIYRLYHYLARIHIFYKNYDVALENLFSTEQISSKMLNRELGEYFKGLSHLFIGHIFNQQKEYDSAKVYLKLALNNSEFTKDLHALGHNYCYLGDLYFNIGQYDSAMYYYNVSADIHENNKEINRLSWARLGIGKTYFQLGDSENALIYLLALINNESQNLEITSQSSDYLSQIYFKQKNYKKAYKYLKINKISSEELINEEKIKEITKLEIEHEYRTKQNELELAREHERSLYIAKLKQNRLTIYLTGGGFITAFIISILIFRSLRQKKKAGKEKEVLLKEIHHRVKNNLQVISSILSLQNKYISDSKVKDALSESQDRVKSMALIHQMLYQQDRFSEINMREYITELSNTIKSSQNGSSNNIQLETKIEDLWFDIDTAVPLGLIVNELLTNAYKYAFPVKTKGQILLEIKQIEPKHYCLSVTDNGIGIPEKLLTEQSTNTLGLNMVNILAKQLKGNLTVANTPGASFNCLFAEIKKTTNYKNINN